MKRPTTGAAVLAGALLLALTACGEDSDSPTSASSDEPSSGDAVEPAYDEPPPEARRIEVAVDADNEFQYVTETTEIEAGLTTVSLTNDGSLTHQVALLRLHDGVDLASFGQQAATDPTGVAAFGLVDGYGGEPGRYALACMVPNAAGPHIASGMLQEVTVG